MFNNNNTTTPSKGLFTNPTIPSIPTVNANTVTTESFTTNLVDEIIIKDKFCVGSAKNESIESRTERMAVADDGGGSLSKTSTSLGY